jgi:ribosome maturation factor RimP
VGSAPLFFLGEKSILAATSTVDAIRGIALRVTASRGFELVDVELGKGPGGHVVRLLVDKDGGIGLEDLQSVSEEISAILDVEDPLPASYTLEVSSPGLDRPLHREADYRRFVGRLAKVSSYELVDGRRHWTGRIVEVEQGILTLRLEREKDALARIPLDKIAHGRLEVEFPSRPVKKQ